MSNLAVVYLDTRPHGFPKFETYFRYARMMRMSPFADDLYMDRTISLDDMSLFTLAMEMRNSLGKNQNAIIYTHAEPNNFVFWIDPKKKNDFDVKEAANLSYHLDLYQRNELREQTMIVDPFLAQNYAGYVDPFNEKRFLDKSPDYLKIGKEWGEYLMDEFAAIRKLKMNHLAIRACRIGQNRDFMRFLGMLFGARSVSAPRLRTASVLGNASVIKMPTNDKDRKSLTDLLSKGKHGANHIYKYENTFKDYGITEPMFFSFYYTKSGKTSFKLSEIVVSHEEAIYEFHMRTAGQTAMPSEIRAIGQLAWHALQGPKNLIFPGEREYLQNMEFVQIKKT